MECTEHHKLTMHSVVRVSESGIFPHVIQYIKQECCLMKDEFLSAVGPLSLTPIYLTNSTSRLQCHFSQFPGKLISAASLLALDSVSGGRHAHPVSVGTQPVAIHIPRDNGTGKPI